MATEKNAALYMALYCGKKHLRPSFWMTPHTVVKCHRPQESVRKRNHILGYLGIRSGASVFLTL